MDCILVVDDDIELCGLVQEYLTSEGFKSEAVHDGELGLQRGLSGEYALAVLDVMPLVQCPDMGRIEHSRSPVITGPLINPRFFVVLIIRRPKSIDPEIRSMARDVMAILMVDDPSIVRSIGAVETAGKLNECASVQ